MSTALVDFSAGGFGDDIEAMIRNAGAVAPLGAAAGALPWAAWSARDAQPPSDEFFSFLLDESSQDSQESAFRVAPAASSVGTTAPSWKDVVFPETAPTRPLPHAEKPEAQARAPPLPTPTLGSGGRKWGTGKQRLAHAKPWPVPGNPEAARAARARRREILVGKRRAARAALVSQARLSSKPKPYAYRARIASTRQRIGGRFVKQTTPDGLVAIPADKFYCARVKDEAEGKAL